MIRISPSERISKELESLLNGTSGETGSVLSAVIRKGTERIIQEALEQEVTDFLGRGRYERSEEDEQVHPLRNGYKPRSLKSAEGRINIELPQVRGSEGPYQSRLWQFLKGHSDMLQALVVEMYARGLSTRDIEEAFTDAEGNCLISKSQVSRLTETLHEEYERFCKRDLSEMDVVYLFLDAVYEPMRRVGRSREAILCSWGILSTGERVLLHVDLANSESYAGWKGFCVNMVRRGLKTPLTITTDGASGLIRAVEEVWSSSLRIRCWKHKMENVLSKVPQEAHGEIKAYLGSIRDAPDWATGRQLAEGFIAKFEKDYGRAVAAFQDDLEASLAHLQLPAIHRKAVRTTNLIERGFEEERRRTKVIPRFFDEESTLKLAFATLWRVSQNWRGVRFSEHETRQIEQLKKRLGITQGTEEYVDLHSDPSSETCTAVS